MIKIFLKFLLNGDLTKLPKKDLVEFLESILNDFKEWKITLDKYIKYISVLKDQSVIWKILNKLWL